MKKLTKIAELIVDYYKSKYYEYEIKAFFFLIMYMY